MADSLNTWAQRYVREVEAHLADLAPAQRAAIVLKLDIQLRKIPIDSYEQIVTALGSPEQFANGFLLHHGKNPFERVPSSSKSIVTEHYRQTNTRPVGTSARRFFKYATIAILGVVVLFVASIFLIPLMIFKFIAVDNFEKDFTFSFTDQKPRLERFQGKLAAQPLKSFTIAISNGQVAVVTDHNVTEITYECEIENDYSINQAEAAKVENDSATVTLLNVENADCDFTVPPAVNLSVNVTNGRIALADTQQNVEANLTNGEIEFESNSKTSFDLDATVQIGSVDGLKRFKASSKNNPPNKKGPQYSAVLSVGSGRIDIE